MVGIVIVSHSEKVAEGAKEIAEQLNDGSVQIEAAGGVEGGIGTNTITIKEAIERLKEKEHILIFVDLGSAVISSEMALELLGDEIKDKVNLVNAPVVEGVVAATVQATTKDGVKNIIKVAEDSKFVDKIAKE